MTKFLHRVTNRSPRLAGIGVLGLTVTSVITFAWAIVKTIKFGADLVDGGWRSDTAVVQLLVVIEAYLLAVVQVIIAIGLYELFIGDLDVPRWLEAHSLDDVKTRLLDALVVFVAIKAVERFVSAAEPLDGLMNAAAAAAILLSLTVFGKLKASKDPRPREPDTSSDPPSAPY